VSEKICENCKHWEEWDEVEEEDFLGLCNNYKSPFYDRFMAPGETCTGFTEI
jgi:hypothetical protein